MIRQIKCLYLLFALGFATGPLSAQDTVSLHEKLYIDSIRKVLTRDYARQMDRYRTYSEQVAASSMATIDSLEKKMQAMERELRDLALWSDELRSDLEVLRRGVEQNEAIIAVEKQRFTRLLLIAGPALLALILLSTVLFFLLIRRHQESTEYKINALKKYTYTEIEETRSDLMQQFKKRVKKIRDGMKKNNEKKKAKKEAKKKHKSKKAKSKKAGK